jgi:hypothetical protein
VFTTAKKENSEFLSRAFEKSFEAERRCGRKESRTCRQTGLLARCRASAAGRNVGRSLLGKPLVAGDDPPARTGNAFIHYDGWSSASDEWVTPDRLRPKR